MSPRSSTGNSPQPVASTGSVFHLSCRQLFISLVRLWLSLLSILSYLSSNIPSVQWQLLHSLVPCVSHEPSLLEIRMLSALDLCWVCLGCWERRHGNPVSTFFILLSCSAWPFCSTECEGLLTCSALGLLIAADFHCRSLSVRKSGRGLG